MKHSIDTPPSGEALRQLENGGGSSARGPRRLLHLCGRSGRNLLLSSGGEIAVRLLNLFTLLLVARYFDPGTFGQYNIFIAYYAIAIVLGNFGLDTLAIRELAISAHRKFDTLLWLRIAAGLVSGLVLVVVGSHLQPERSSLVFLLALTMIPAAPAAAYAAAFKAHQQFGPPALAAGFGALAGLAMAGAGVMMNADLPFFIIGFVASEIIRAAALVFAGRGEDWASWDGFDLRWARTAIAAALPYGILALLGMIYFRIDLVMLDMMLGGDPVGHYAAAFRLLEVGAALPGIIMGVLFPRFALLQHANVAAARELYLSATRLMLPLGFVLAAAGILFARFIVSGIFGPTYVAAVPTLTWLLAALVILFWHAPNVAVLFSRVRLATTIYWSTMTVAFNVLANWILIPAYAARGAAIATVLSELLSLAIFTPLVCRYLGISSWHYMRRLTALGPVGRDLDLLLDRD